MTPDMQAEIELLEAAMEGVKLVTCDACDEKGNIPNVPTGVPCKRCGGKKVTTTSEATE